MNNESTNSLSARNSELMSGLVMCPECRPYLWAAAGHWRLTSGPMACRALRTGFFSSLLPQPRLSGRSWQGQPLPTSNFFSWINTGLSLWPSVRLS